MTPALQLSRALYFDCAHSYQVKSWTQDENLKEFGPCFSPVGHGHTYRLEAFVEGPVDPVSGMILNLRDLDDLLKLSVTPLQGKFLDREVPEFLEKVPTTENIALFLFEKLAVLLEQKTLKLCRIRLFETEDLWVECQS